MIPSINLWVNMVINTISGPDSREAGAKGAPTLCRTPFSKYASLSLLCGSLMVGACARKTHADDPHAALQNSPDQAQATNQTAAGDKTGGSAEGRLSSLGRLLCHVKARSKLDEKDSDGFPRTQRDIEKEVLTATGLRIKEPADRASMLRAALEAGFSKAAVSWAARQLYVPPEAYASATKTPPHQAACPKQ